MQRAEHTEVGELIIVVGLAGALRESRIRAASKVPACARLVCDSHWPRGHGGERAEQRAEEAAPKIIIRREATPLARCQACAQGVLGGREREQQDDVLVRELLGRGDRDSLCCSCCRSLRAAHTTSGGGQWPASKRAMLMYM